MYDFCPQGHSIFFRELTKKLMVIDEKFSVIDVPQTAAARRHTQLSFYVNYRSISEEGVAGVDDGITFADAGFYGNHFAVFDGSLHVIPMRVAILGSENHRLAAAKDHRSFWDGEHIADVLADFDRNIHTLVQPGALQNL